MQALAYPAFATTTISVIALSYLAFKEHKSDVPRTFSELATKDTWTLRYFRTVLVLCGTLFAISMYGFVIPRIKLAALQAISWTLTYLPELTLAWLPAKGRTLRWHNFFGLLMGCGMLGSAFLFALTLGGAYGVICAVITGVMVVLAAGTFVDKKRFIFYELPFIFLAHCSVLLAVLALS